LLDCTHRICFKCYGNGHTEDVDCSFCFQVTKVEAGKRFVHSSGLGLQTFLMTSIVFDCFRLPKDYFMIGLLSDKPSLDDPTCTKESGAKTKVFARESCVKCGAFTLKACTECERRFCGSCFEESHNDVVWKDHRLVDSFAVSNFKKKFSNIDDSICSRHEDSQKAFCVTCETVVCRGCDLGHSEHITTSVRTNLANYYCKLA